MTDAEKLEALINLIKSYLADPALHKDGLVFAFEHAFEAVIDRFEAKRPLDLPAMRNAVLAVTRHRLGILTQCGYRPATLPVSPQEYSMLQENPGKDSALVIHDQGLITVSVDGVRIEPTLYMYHA